MDVSGSHAESVEITQYRTDSYLKCYQEASRLRKMWYLAANPSLACLHKLAIRKHDIAQTGIKPQTLGIL